MKLSIIIGAILLIIFCNATNIMDDLLQICKTLERATDNDVVMWRTDSTNGSHGKPTPRIIKCLVACVAEKSGVFMNKRLNVEALKTGKFDEKALSTLKAVLNKCGTITNPDRCEMTYKTLDCIIDEGNEHGVQLFRFDGFDF